MEVLYRYDSRVISSSNELFADYKVFIREFSILNKTPKGVNIMVNGVRKWVSLTAKKRFAYPTKKEALQSFVARKKMQIKILEVQLTSAKICLRQAKEIQDIEANKEMYGGKNKGIEYTYSTKIDEA